MYTLEVMRTTVWEGRQQEMVLPEGRAKGMKIVLQERGVDVKGLNVTRYEKRDRSGYFIIFAFLVSIDSYACVRSNGANQSSISTSEAELFAFKYTRVARCPEIIFRDTGTFSYFLFFPSRSVILDDVTFNNLYCVICRVSARRMRD